MSKQALVGREEAALFHCVRTTNFLTPASVVDHLRKLDHQLTPKRRSRNRYRLSQCSVAALHDQHGLRRSLSRTIVLRCKQSEHDILRQGCA
jgi:hypothetical protein